MSRPVGLYEDISHEEYHGDPAELPSLSSSMAHLLVSKSPLHAWYKHPRLGGGAGESTRAMDRGTMIHKLLLGRGQDFAEIEADSYRTDRAQRQKAGAIADGLIPVLSHELESYQAMATIYRDKLKKRKEPIVFSGPTEVTGIFMLNGVLCRIRLDHWNRDEVMIDDIKTCKSANPKDIALSMYNFGSDIQNVLYTSGVGVLIPELADRIRMRFIFLEAEPPYDVVVVELDGAFLDLGQKRVRRAIDTWAGCLSANDWPGYASETLRLAPPAWAAAADLERTLIAMQNPPPAF